MIVETLINTAQKMRFSIKDFFSKCDQIRRTQQIPWRTFVRCVRDLSHPDLAQ